MPVFALVAAVAGRLLYAGRTAELTLNGKIILECELEQICCAQRISISSVSGRVKAMYSLNGFLGTLSVLEQDK